MRRHLLNIWHLGVKELWSLWREPVMLVLIVYLFSVALYTAATAMPETLHNSVIAIVDEDRSPLSGRIATAFYPPHFNPPVMVSHADLDPGMDAGEFTFALIIPVNFQRDMLAGKTPTLQLNVDATRMSQAFSGSGYVQEIVTEEVREFMASHRTTITPPVDLALRMRFNPTLEPSWFGSVMEMVNSITMLSIILTGAALIREREHGTIEHLLVMPVTPTEIMIAKVWSMGVVVMLATAASMTLVIRGAIGVPIEGSMLLFFAGAMLSLFATTSMGIFMATVARSMPQFGLLLVLTLLPLQMLSGGSTPRESMPEFVQFIMLAAPTTHLISLSQAVLYRGAGLETVWPQLLGLLVIGVVLFAVSLRRFRKTLAGMG